MVKIKNETRRNRTFHILITIIACTLVVSGIILGIWFYVFNRNHEETNDAQVEQYVTPIMSRITGYVQEVRFDENQFVHKGDTLVVIDNREYKSKLNVALADVQNAKQNSVVAEKNAVNTASATAINESQLDAAKSNLWKTKLEYERYKALVSEEAATSQQLEKVRADYESAQAHFSEMKNRIHSATLSTSVAEANVPTTQTNIASKQAVADNAALFLSYTVITAPYDGWVGKRTLQPGQMVKEGQSLLSIVSREKWITANFKETQLQYLTVGQEVEIKADAVNDKVFVGTIASLSPASGARFSLLPPDNATGNFVKIEQRIPVRIQLKEQDKQTDFLRAGMNITVVAAHK
ncbi:membrane fusion protein, multidrug efflux system [Flavobacterium resistens]|uniref:HlyD family efflux transporter periplasmic adaptor subunit n=1 Tax=Flavobacterium resistens TaxID=443612 RepID=A0A521CCK6_9FLAO|nr:HlyD family secretion protein [Flavobacterium resistens]MRX66486.1 HlyD family efflux transporter periplasmic adaptor subunit [Flavobacterium resistens]SMO56531.1 membrane fusion protein, multidrug efflux system [Flavobacterium resistens]